MRTARTALLLILALLPACDNVSWGGTDVAIVRPPPKPAGGPATNADSADQSLPSGPVLFYVRRDSSRATMTPIAEITGDSLAPVRALRDPRAYGTRFIAEQMRQGSEFALFSNGARMGTFVVQSAEVADSPNECLQVPTAIGSLELSAAGDSAREFLALSKPHAPQVPRRLNEQLTTSRTMQVISPILAERMIRARRAPLPGNWQRAMAQLKPFPAANQQDAAYATTFVVGDTLGPGLDSEGYSLFYIGVPALSTFDTVFVSYHDYATDGKQAPRVIDFLDWNRDDQVELLLRVYGVNDSWFEAVGRNSEGVWRRIFRDRCELAASSVPADTTQPPDTTSS